MCVCVCVGNTKAERARVTNVSVVCMCREHLARQGRETARVS